jgi:MFS family permease
VQVEFLEIKADAEFERAIFDKRFPELSKAAGNSIWRREFAQYSNTFRSKDNFKRVALASVVMFMQQWTGIDSSKSLFPSVPAFIADGSVVIYYASIIFQTLGLTSSTISLLASGVIGIINVATTIPAIYFIDKVGRKPLMMAGSVGMCICEIVIGVILATCGHDWIAHSAAGWAVVGRLLPPKY